MALAAAVVGALAVWVSLGVMAVAGDLRSPRLGMLPAWWVPVVAGLVLLALACWRRIPQRVWWPALVPALLLLPWLPFRVPACFLLWTGPVAWLVWGGTAAAVVAALMARDRDRGPVGQAFAEAGADDEPGPARRLARLAGGGASWPVLAASVAVFGLVAWLTAPVRPAGDEPHYLVITQSILLDGDLRIENNHAREHYVAYYSADLRPDYLQRGKDGEIYSVHAPGLPALVAPAFAVGGYPAVVVFLVLVSAVGAGLVWRTSRDLTGSTGAAWFGWAAVCLSVPFLCHAAAVFPDGPSAVLVMTGLAALVRLERAGVPVSSGVHRSLPRAEGGAGQPWIWLLHGAALALLPWLHTRAAAAAGVLGACIALRLVAARHWDRLAAFAVVPLAGAAAWFGFFYAVYGNISPAAAYGTYTQSSLAKVWPGLPAIVFDQQYGVLPNAPVYGVALAGLVLLFRTSRRLATEVAALLLVYLVAVASYQMWWGGWSAPARFAVPVLLALGPCAAVLWARGGEAARAGAMLALVLSLMTGAVFAGVAGGALMFNSRDGVARWLEWLCPLVDLPRALPSFFHGSAAGAVGDAAVWVAVMGLGWLSLRWFRRMRTAAAPLLFAVATMTAATIVWGAHGFSPVTPTGAQLRLMSAFDPAALPIGVRYQPTRFREPADLVPRLRVSVSERRPPRPNPPLLTIRELPAGTYRVLRAAPGVPRQLDVFVQDSAGPLASCAFESAGATDCVFRLPVNARELHVAAASPPAATVPPRAIELQPLDLLAARERPASLRATAAARYGDVTVFAFDHRAFLEPHGLWVRGGVEVPLVVASGAPRPSLPLLLRNGARPNLVHVRLGAFRLDLSLAPRQERTVEIPLDPRPGAALLHVHAEQGFRPSETDPGSTDERYLGVWIQPAREQ